MKTLFKNCYVLCGHEIKFTSLLVEDEYIRYIGDEPQEYDYLRDMKGALLMPGLVNAHAHGPMTLLRGVGGGLALQDWLNNAIFPREAKMKPDDIRIGENWAIIEMLTAGITCTAEMYDFPWELGESLVKSGMKGNICRVGLSFSDQEEIPPNRFNECVEMVEKFNDPTGKVVADFCLHSEYLSTDSIVEKIAEANKKYKRLVHVHVAETKAETDECKLRHNGLTPIQYFNKMGILDQKVYAAHCVWVNDDDLAIMKEKDVSIVHNPTSNMKLGSGFAPIRKAMANGVNVCLGTDGVASNNSLNIFKEMHLASIIHNGHRLDPLSIKPPQVIDMATINGAKALGRYDTGILEVGKKADIIAVSLDKPHMYPVIDVLSLLCYSVQSSDVVMTMVDGKILYDHGDYTTMDFEKAKFELAQSLKSIL
ncbi:MAG: amidohydrolase [Bacillota bacterium]|nr:amidohydrolase [Bacillota bacterium]